MLEYQKKKEVRKLMYSKVTLILLFIVVVLLAKGVWNIYEKAQESEKNKVAAQAEYDKLVARQGLLSQQINDLKTPEGVEKEIRGKFNVVKDGEQVVVVVDKSKADAKAEAPGEESFWTKILNFFRK